MDGPSVHVATHGEKEEKEKEGIYLRKSYTILLYLGYSVFRKRRTIKKKMRSSAKGLISVPKRTWIPIFNHRGTAHRHVKNHAKKMGGKKKKKKTTKKAILCYTVRQANKMLGGG